MPCVEMELGETLIIVSNFLHLMKYLIRWNAAINKY